MANANMSIGPTTQLRNNEMPNTLVLLNTSFNLLYRTLAKGGYIINIKPMASGTLVVPDENDWIKPEDEGTKNQ